MFPIYWPLLYTPGVKSPTSANCHGFNRATLIYPSWISPQMAVQCARPVICLVVTSYVGMEKTRSHDLVPKNGHCKYPNPTKSYSWFISISCTWHSHNKTAIRCSILDGYCKKNQPQNPYGDTFDWHVTLRMGKRKRKRTNVGQGGTSRGHLVQPSTLRQDQVYLDHSHQMSEWQTKAWAPFTIRKHYSSKVAYMKDLWHCGQKARGIVLICRPKH